jgi:hypothetical protein
MLLAYIGRDWLPERGVQRPIRDESVQTAHVWLPCSHHLPALRRASRLRRLGRGHPLGASFPRQPGRNSVSREERGRAREMARVARVTARSCATTAAPPRPAPPRAPPPPLPHL